MLLQLFPADLSLSGILKLSVLWYAGVQADIVFFRGVYFP